MATVTSLYNTLLIFVAFYPIITSLMWIVFSLTYKTRWEHKSHEIFQEFTPFVSVIIPAYNEERLIRNGLKAVLNMDYPDYEVIVINDGSQDKTLEHIKGFLSDPKLRVINKIQNQGKAMALNDALHVAKGEFIVIFDADAEPDPKTLYHMIWHFQHARVGAVSGHPRVKNIPNIITRIQVVEFASIIGLLRRSQRMWGRIVTVSGIAAAFRKSALFDVNGFQPDMYTEDIDITWRLQKRHWDIRYEPRAIVWMHVPEKLSVFFKQRLRWARGLLQVLRVHRDVIQTTQRRRMWPVYIEACLSTFWNTAYGFVLSVEIISIFLIPNQLSIGWLVVLATASLFQLFVGVFLEYHHDKQVFRYFFYAIFYPFFYWMFMFIVTTIALPVLRQPVEKKVEWSTDRS